MTRIRAAKLDLREFIRPGNRIVWGQATGEPLTLTETLMTQRNALGPVSVFLGACFSDTLRPEHVDTIRFRSFGPMGSSRAFAKAGALEIDLTGQVNAEAAGDDLLGAVGDQPDLVRAGYRSPGGHAIIALPSTARGGRVSRIRPTLNGPMTTPRSDVDVLVTEYGAADLRGLTLMERARALVAIAHPEHRDALADHVSDSAGLV